MTLSEVPLGSSVRIRGFRALGHAERARLAALGVKTGAAVTKILRTPLQDPVECLVGSQLLALECWLLERIEVEAVS